MRAQRSEGELFFLVGIRVFFAAALASLLVVALGGIVQMRVLGAFAFACAFVGVAVCALGVRIVSPEVWRTRMAHALWVLGLRHHRPYRTSEELIGADAK
ncbi:MAG TPA: hypothetical protein VMV45_16075 [Casimicrobiaceae bacterium]|nr:hypothetical protein [Casimicrobiaceae bacterium]